MKKQKKKYQIPLFYNWIANVALVIGWGLIFFIIIRFIITGRL